MMVTAINLASITQAIESALVNDSNFSDWSISRGEVVNDSPDQCPWVGIYKREQRYEPLTLGRGAGSRRFECNIIIAVQETSFTSGADCEDKLEEGVKNVMTVILTDPQLGGLIDMVNEAKISYSYDAAKDEEDESYFQTAWIELTVEAQTS